MECVKVEHLIPLFNDNKAQIAGPNCDGHHNGRFHPRVSSSRADFPEGASPFAAGKGERRSSLEQVSQMIVQEAA